MSTISKALAAGWALSALLWVAPVTAADDSAVRPGDDALTCEQIATELAPYAKQMMSNIQALGASSQQLYAQGREMGQQRMAEHALLMPLAQAGALDPTGASKRAYVAAEMAQTAKEQSENEAFHNSALAKQNQEQNEEVAAQAQQMQSNARLQHLMQLAQAKHCDKR